MAAGERHKLSIACRMFYVVELRGCKVVPERHSFVGWYCYISHKRSRMRIPMNIRKTSVLLLLLGCLGMMSACGKDETVPANAQAEGMEEAQMREEPSDEESVSPEEETDNGQTETEDISDTEEIIVEEPLKSQLTAELLEENNLDPSVVGETRVTKGCSFTLPEEFEPAEDMEGMYVTGRYPIDASTIYYAELEKDTVLQLMTEESFTQQIQENLEEIYGEEVEVTIDSFEQIKMQGYPAFKILCHYQVGDVKVTQLEYAINADKSYVITYSQTGDYDRMEEYEASAETIKVE